jgi:hypothetical protein
MAVSPRLPPFVVTAVKTTPAHHVRRKVIHNVDEVLAPVVDIVIPCGFDGAVGDAERLHELHV